jgi:hypothetical protein
MRDYMWDEETSTFLSVRKDTMIRIPGATISSWLPITPYTSELVADLMLQLIELKLVL